MHAAIQHRAQSFRHHRAHSGKSLGDGIRPQRQHRPRFRLAQRRAHSAGMAAHQIHLQFANLFAGNPHGGELAETGIDAIYRLVRGDQPLDHRARCQHLFARRRSQLHRRAIENDAIQNFTTEIFAVYLNRAHEFCGSRCAEMRGAKRFCGREVLAIFFGKRFRPPQAIADDVHRIAGGQQLAGRLMHDFVAEFHRAPLRGQHASAHQEHVIKSRGPFVTAMRVRHHDVTIVFGFHLFIFKAELPAQFHAPHFKPSEIISVIDHTHLVRLGVTHTNCGLGVIHGRSEVYQRTENVLERCVNREITRRRRKSGVLNSPSIWGCASPGRKPALRENLPCRGWRHFPAWPARFPAQFPFRHSAAAGAWFSASS